MVRVVSNRPEPLEFPQVRIVRFYSGYGKVIVDHWLKIFDISDYGETIVNLRTNGIRQDLGRDALGRRWFLRAVGGGLMVVSDRGRTQVFTVHHTLD